MMAGKINDLMLALRVNSEKFDVLEREILNPAQQDNGQGINAASDGKSRVETVFWRFLQLQEIGTKPAEY